MPSHKKKDKQVVLAAAAPTLAVALALLVLVTTSASMSAPNSIMSHGVLSFLVKNAYGDSGYNRNQNNGDDGDNNNEHGVLQQGANNGGENVAQVREGAFGTEVNSGAAFQGGNPQRIAQQVNGNSANNIANDDDNRGDRSRNVRSSGSVNNSLAASIGNTVLAGTIAAIIGAAAYTAYRIVRVKQKRMTLVKGGSNITNSSSSSNNAPPS